MPIKLVVTPRNAVGGDKSWERCFDQDAVTIGRASSNDLNLADPQRVVSSRHAEIRRKAQQCVLVDVGSTNGTIVNDQRLVSGKEYPLHRGDQIRIGTFTICFYPFVPPEKQPQVTPSVSQQTGLSSKEADKAEALLSRLRRLYATMSQRDPKEREDVLVETLHEALRGLDHNQAEALLKSVKGGFPVSEMRSAPAVSASAHEFKVAAPHSIRAEAMAYEVCVALAQRYCKDLELPVSADLIQQVMERIDRILKVMVNSLADAIKGRKQFAREFDVEATRILAWSPNRIKLAESGQEIGEYLLDPRKQDTNAETIVAELERVFRDLALHQVGLVAGFRECLRGLMSELNPESIEAEARGALPRLGSLTVPFLVSWAAWRHFKDKHRQLSEEEVKVFERILAPDFAKGYLVVHKAPGRR